VVLQATKATGHGDVQRKTMVAHQGQHLHEIVSAVQMFRKTHCRKEHLVAQKAFVIHRISKQWIFQHH
jgi:hypothetical protein